MDLLSFGFLLLVVLLGGVIAYLADRLGRILGKKRLSFLGMRPRHTAELFTVAAGIFIPFLTILIVMALSKEVRLWIQIGPRLQHELEIASEAGERLKKTNADLEVENQKRREELKATQSKFDALQSKNASLTTAIRERTEKIAALNGRLGGLQTQLASANGRLATVLREVKVTQANIQKVQGELDSVQQQRDLAAADLKNLHGTYDVLSDQHKELNKKYLQLDSQLQSLETARDGLTTTIGELQVQIVTLQKDTQSYQDQVEQKRNELEHTKQKLDEITGQLNWQNTLFDRISGPAKNARWRPLAFQRQEELSRQAVAPNLTAKKAEALLANFMKSLQVRALAQGAIDAKIFDLPSEDMTRGISAEEQRQKILGAMTNSKTPLVLLGSAALNVFQGEPVPLEFKVAENPIVYEEGQTLAEVRINGSEEPDRLMQQINDFLVNKVGKQAKEDKMIPVHSRTDSYGELTQTEFLKLIDDLQAANRPLRLLAVAADTTRAGDLLRLKFRIRY